MGTGVAEDEDPDELYIDGVRAESEGGVVRPTLAELAEEVTRRARDLEGPTVERQFRYRQHLESCDLVREIEDDLGYARDALAKELDKIVGEANG